MGGSNYVSIIILLCDSFLFSLFYLVIYLTKISVSVRNVFLEILVTVSDFLWCDPAESQTAILISLVQYNKSFIILINQFSLKCTD